MAFYILMMNHLYKDTHTSPILANIFTQRCFNCIVFSNNFKKSLYD
jgi:hypothetical protein